MKLIWTQIAHVDRKKICEYISQDNPSAALKFDQLLFEKAEKLVKLLNSWSLRVNCQYT